MSLLSIVPELLCASADNLHSIGSGLSAGNTVALAPTTGLAPAAADPVSGLTALQFVAHAQMYQTISAQATGIHQMFVTTLGTSAGAYTSTEAANTVAAR